MLDEVLTEDEVATLVKTPRRKIAKSRLDGRALFPYCMVAGVPRYVRSEVLRVLTEGMPSPVNAEAEKRGRGRPRAA